MGNGGTRVNLLGRVGWVDVMARIDPHLLAPPPGRLAAAPPGRGPTPAGTYHALRGLFGLGELAGWQIRGEKPGIYPDQAIPERRGGVGRMCSFGEGISMTPLQLGALVAAVERFRQGR